MSKWCQFLLCLLLAVAAKGSKMHMPSFTTTGAVVKIECELDHETYEIEHVKWYKDNQLFYTVTPSSTPPGMHYDLHGVPVDKDESTMNKVVLNDVTEYTSGLYTCELKTNHGMARMSGTLTVYTTKE